MSLYVLGLVLTAAILHACWNLLAKKTKGKTPFIWLLYIASSVLYLPFLFFYTNRGIAIYSQPLLWFSLSSAVLHIGYFIVLQNGYRKADLSVVYPLAGISAARFIYSGNCIPARKFKTKFGSRPVSDHWRRIDYNRVKF